MARKDHTKKKSARRAAKKSVRVKSGEIAKRKRTRKKGEGKTRAEFIRVPPPNPTPAEVDRMLDLGEDEVDFNDIVEIAELDEEGRE